MAMLSIKCFMYSLTIVGILTILGYSFMSISYTFPDKRTINDILHAVHVAPPKAVEECWSEQRRRIQHIQDACADPDLFLNQTYRGRSRLKYLFSPKYNFSYCKVPKVGCTFWVQIFTALQKGTESTSEIFGMSRQVVHRRLSSQHQVHFASPERQQSRTILIARDPYSRLYSAFVDKIFLPACKPMLMNYQRNNSDFIYHVNLEFQEFLKNIVTTAYRGQSLSGHWMPITSLCHPCNVNLFALVKQESFSSDVQLVLKELALAKDEFEAINRAIHDHSRTAIISSLIKDIQETGVGKKGCKTKLEEARDIWISFQIQGYIRDKIPFPEKHINSEKIDITPKVLIDIVLKTIKEHPLTSDESKQQRHRALVKAYENIDKKTIDGLKEIYKQDFVVFNYSFEPPSMQKY